MAGPAYVQQQLSSKGSLSTSFTPTLPSGLTVGNLLVMSVEIWGSSNPTLSTPSGWTQLIDGSVLHGFGDHQRLYVFVKKIASGETAPALSTTANATFDVAFLEYSGQDATTPTDGTASSSARSTSTSPPCPAITTSAADSLVLYFLDGDPTPTAVPSGSTSRLSWSTPAGGSHMSVADKPQATAATVAATSWSAPNSGSQGVVGATMAIKAASAFTRVTNTVTLNYKVNGRVSSTRALAYAITSRVSATRTLVYGLGTFRISATRTLVYALGSRVSTSRRIVYPILLPPYRVSGTRQLRWAVTGRTSSSVELDYNLVPGTDPPGRFCLAFDAQALDWNVAWTRIDAYPNLVTSYSIDRGRQYELDRTDTGRATVQIIDPDGVLDPRNPGGPFYGKIQPLIPARLGRRNPVTGEWKTRYRGWVESFAYGFDPSQRFNRLTVSLVDMFEVLAAVGMQPGKFGTPPRETGSGQITWTGQHMDDRIILALDQAGIPAKFRVVFTGNVTLQIATYSAGESPMTVIQDAADAEFPGVSNVFCDRQGRLCVHGRLSKFYPDMVAGEASIGAWDFQRWKAGDAHGIALYPGDTAQLRTFGFQRDLSKVINQATATPNGIADSAVAGQLVEDTTSTGKYGIRSWSATNLLTEYSLLDGSHANEETRRFATYYVQNYAEPRDRVVDVSFRSLRPDDPRGPATWKLMSEIDIADVVAVTVSSPGSPAGEGGFVLEDYFVEGIHEQAQPLNDDYDDVTLALDLSPAAYFAANPWPDTGG